MNQKSKPAKRKKTKAVRIGKHKVTGTTRSLIGKDISFYLDLMNDPRFADDNFRQLREQAPRSFNLHVASDEMDIHFSISWKGGKNE